MAERTSYPHGTFSWVENATTDQDAAKNFYATLFGWEYDERELGDGYVYSMAMLDGHQVGAVSPQMQNERDAHVPAHWNNYVTVDEVDVVAGRVAELGGDLLAPPFDVMDAGRMAVLMAPNCGVLCLWQAGRNPGAGLVNAPGALCWNELGTRDPDAAQQFYGELLGWTFDSVPESPVPYWTIRNGERSNGGMRLMGDETPEAVPAHWLPYFGVDSIDATLEKASAAGGTVIVPKTVVWGDSSFAALNDPIGAGFAIFEGGFDD